MDDSGVDIDQQKVDAKAKNEKKKEERRLARLVQEKMEDYMNKTKRENHFDPAGIHRTNARMHKYDYMYKVIEATVLQESAKEKQKLLEKNGKMWGVHPKPLNNSRQVTRGVEALHLSQTISNIWIESVLKTAKQVLDPQNEDDVPVTFLTTLHGFGAGRGRAWCANNPGLARWDLRLQGYTSHVGAALHGKKFADYYRNRGLTGDLCRRARLIDLKMRDRLLSSSCEYTSSTLNQGNSGDRSLTRQASSTYRMPAIPNGDKSTQNGSPYINESQQWGDTALKNRVEPTADDHCPAIENAEHTDRYV